MIETYYDIITKIENFVDGLMIVDENGLIKYNKQFAKGPFQIDEKQSLGKTPMEVFPNLTEETSTCYRALKYGETTKNQLQTLNHNGVEITVLDTTFPVIEKGKVIGAVSTTRFIETSLTNDFIDLSTMTSSHKTDFYEISDIMGSSEGIQLLKYKIHKVSKTSSSVLIYGETGTGKELVAQSIHSSSSRRSNRFISQNCAAIPHTLLESIFFGTTKGIYTGAENKPGIFELADGGTIFLDEINSMDLSMQAKLLKAIEEKKVTRIGSSESKKIDVRIIAAVNENPLDCINSNRMRKDLYYRLSSLQIKVPPLRERKTDIPELLDHFIKIFNSEIDINITGVSDEVSDIFRRYAWPGNIREFRNTVESAMNFATSETIEKQDLPETLLNKEISGSHISSYGYGNLNEAVAKFEKDFILSRSKDIKSLSELAERLDISKQSLNYKLKKYNLNL